MDCTHFTVPAALGLFLPDGSQRGDGHPGMLNGFGFFAILVKFLTFGDLYNEM